MDGSFTRESLSNIRTVREIVGGMDLARTKPPIKTSILLARGGKETPATVSDAAIAPLLMKEQLRFQKRLASVNRSRMKLLGFRQKLANIKEKNRRVMDLRLKLYKEHWNETSPVLNKRSHKELATPAAASSRARSKHKTFKYGGR